MLCGRFQSIILGWLGPKGLCFLCPHLCHTNGFNFVLNSEPSAQGPLYLVASPFCGHECPSLLSGPRSGLFISGLCSGNRAVVVVPSPRPPKGSFGNCLSFFPGPRAPGPQGQRGGEVEQPRLEHWTNSLFFPFRKQGLTPVIFPINTKSAPRRLAFPTSGRRGGWHCIGLPHRPPPIQIHIRSSSDWASMTHGSHPAAFLS